MTERIRDFLARHPEEGPRLVVDLDVVRENYLSFAKALPDTRVFYAVKANPAPEILDLLVGLGSCFDTASLAEIEQALAAGASPERISFGNTIKKERDIARAFALGVASLPSIATEVDKVARAAPGQKCSAGSCATAPAPNGRCRASSAARRTWRRGCWSARIGSGSSRTGFRSMSARSSATRACGTPR